MVYVSINDELQNGRIFQQDCGFADISVKGVVKGLEKAGGHVLLLLLREADSTLVIPPVRVVSDADGHFGVVMHVPVGGMYTLRSMYMDKEGLENGSNGDNRFRLGVGDVYAIAGQSNAVGYGRTPGAEAADNRVAVFGLDRVWNRAVHPLSSGADYRHTIIGEWFATGVSPYISFASLLARELNYPIGLVQTAQGGMSIAQWEKGKPIYNEMAGAVRAAGGKLKGVLWYQGCSDTDKESDAERYLNRFEAFVKDFREDIGFEVPFLTIQINRFVCTEDDKRNLCWAKVKEAQRQAAKRIPNVLITAAHDIPLNDYAHNSTQGQQLLGQRLAWLALEKVYAKPFFATCPELVNAVINGKNIELIFSGVLFALMDYSLPCDKCDFLFEDDTGSIPLTAYHTQGGSVFVVLARLPRGHVICSFAPYCLHSGFLPADRATGLPPLSFYRVDITPKVGA